MKSISQMGNPNERISREHLVLYRCFTDLIRDLVVPSGVSDSALLDKQLKKASSWFKQQQTSTEFRNKARGLTLEALEEQLQEELDKIKLLDMIKE